MCVRTSQPTSAGGFGKVPANPQAAALSVAGSLSGSAELRSPVTPIFNGGETVGGTPDLDQQHAKV